MKMVSEQQERLTTLEREEGGPREKGHAHSGFEKGTMYDNNICSDE